MRDYKLIDKSPRFKRPKRVRFSGMHWLLLGVAISVLASTIVLMPNNAAATRTEKLNSKSATDTNNSKSFYAWKYLLYSADN